MDIVAAKEAKQRMESVIQEKVAAAVAEFYESTGMTPERISIEMVETTTISDAVRRYSVGNVSSDVAL